MGKKAVSVTLDTDNLAWLQGQARATRARGLSQALDRIVTEARLGGRVAAQAIRSVAGTIDIHDDDPALERADAYIRSMFDRSLQRPMIARETPPVAARPPRAAPGAGRKGKRRG